MTTHHNKGTAKAKMLYPFVIVNNASYDDWRDVRVPYEAIQKSAPTGIIAKCFDDAVTP